MAQTIPLSVPDELLEEVRETAKMTNLSVQDVFRQSTKLGMPALREAAGRVPRPKRLSVWDVIGASAERIGRSGDKLQIHTPTDKARKIVL
jgi:hypothetical protein